MQRHINGYYEDIFYLFIVYTLCFVKYIAICKLSPLYGGVLMRTQGVPLPDQDVTAARDTIAAVDVRRIYGGFFSFIFAFFAG